jgi:hypothetical protein
VAYKIEGQPGIRVAGLTGNRKADYAKTIERLSTKLGERTQESKAGVYALLRDFIARGE